MTGTRGKISVAACARTVASVAALAALTTSACGGGNNDRGPHVLMDWTRATGFFDAPFPSDDLTPAAAAAAFPNPKHVALVEQARALAGASSGYATTAGIFFRISSPIDPAALPDLAGSERDDAAVFLVDLGGTGGTGTGGTSASRVPVDVTFQPQASVYGAPDLLAIVPLQGAPLAPGHRYAAVITTALRTADGTNLAPATDDDLAPFADALASLAVDRARIAGLTVFTTGDPAAGLACGRTAALARPRPVPTAFTLTDTFADFCAYHATIDMPDFQAGTPPFDSAGGAWLLDGDGAPIYQRDETANLVVTLPRTAPPPAGYPIVVFVRTGGGGDRPLVDRGQQASHDAPALEPGEGPARYLARAGFAAIEVDGPIGGLRNTTHADEQFLTFNINNLGAMRDNLREAAIELDVLAAVATALHLDATPCGGAKDVGFDASHVAIMGHSMGAWIAPLAVAHEPAFGAVVMSGAGGSWIENILWKQKPTPVYPVVSALLHEQELRADDPVLSLAQWALEPADPTVYTRRFAGHVLMEQGIVDDYILPNIANATSYSLGLTLAGTELDTTPDDRLVGQRPFGALPHVATTALPAAGGRVLVQHAEDGVEDGHEVVFQTDGPKHQYQCFLRSWLATGAPIVVPDAARDAPCP